MTTENSFDDQEELELNEPSEKPADHAEEQEPQAEAAPEEAAEEEEIEDEAESSPSDEGGAATSKPEVQLQEILEAAKIARISPAEEERAVQLLKQTVAGGPKALAATLEAILSLPWSVGVKAVTEVWPETKPAGRTRLLTGLAKADSDVSRRIRLSLARGLHGQDPASALKLLVSVCEAMGGAQGGSTTKDRQIFANVMLGKARPWLMNIPMVDMKPAEAQKLITPALEACHQAPIFTQIWVLRWICDAGKFETLPPEHIDSIGKSINRWQPRWRKELRKIIPKLPEPLEAVLSDSHGHAPAQPAPASAATPTGEADFPAHDAPQDEREPDGDDAADEEEREAVEPRPLETRIQPQSSRSRQDSGRGSSRDRGGDRRGDRGGDREVQGPFDLNRTLRDIEGYVARLKAELQQAQVASRRREPDRGRGRSTSVQVSAPPEELEELRRHNGQLDEQNQELRQRIEELTGDHEDRAATLEISDSLEQFKTFLGLKLKDEFADFSAINRESLTEVVRRNAHEILGRIFSVLQAEGVKFEKKE